MRAHFAFVTALIFLIVRSVQGQDCRPDPNTRTRVTEATLAPYRYICALEVYRGKGRKPKRSTGFLVSPTLILTAGHTVRQKRRKIVRIIIRPFANDTLTNSLSFTYPVSKLGLWIDPHYGRPKHRSSDDYGAIKLPDDALFRLTKGHFSWNQNYQYLKDGESPSVQIAGYPCDKDAYEMFEQTGNISKLGDQYMNYNLYTRSRNSGSPVWTLINGVPIVVGIHNSGGDKATKKNKCRTPKQKKCNSGTRINKAVYDRIVSWIN